METTVTARGRCVKGWAAAWPMVMGITATKIVNAPR